MVALQPMVPAERALQVYDRVASDLLTFVLQGLVTHGQAQSALRCIGRRIEEYWELEMHAEVLLCVDSPKRPLHLFLTVEGEGWTNRYKWVIERSGHVSLEGTI